MTPADIVAESRRWKDTPYQHQASIRGIAADCIGHIAGVARAGGVREAAAWEADARRRAYAANPDADMLLAAADQYMDRVPLAQVRIADVLIMRLGGKLPRHFALISSLEPLRVIHAYASAGRVVENIIDRKWAARIVCAYRFRGM